MGKHWLGRKSVKEEDGYVGSEARMGSDYNIDDVALDRARYWSSWLLISRFWRLASGSVGLFKQERDGCALLLSWRRDLEISSSVTSARHQSSQPSYPPLWFVIVNLLYGNGGGAVKRAGGCLVLIIALGKPVFVCS